MNLKTTARRITLASATTALVLGGLMGCSPDKPTITPAGSPPATSQSAPAPAPAPAKKDANVAAFGDTVTYKSGLAITVAVPEAFAPSATAFGAEQAVNLTFTITVSNGSPERFDPSMLMISASADGVEGSRVFDSAQGLEGPGQTSVAQGASTTIKVAFSFASNTKITLEVHPLMSDSAIFESNK